jgi:hypothetical protein
MPSPLTLWSVRRKAKMDEQVGKALDHLIQHKLLFAGQYRLQAAQRCIGGSGAVQMAYVRHSQARPETRSCAAALQILW